MPEIEQVVIEGGEDGGIYIYDAEGVEIVSWTADEFQEDVTVALSALNCLKMFYEQGEAAVKETIGWQPRPWEIGDPADYATFEYGGRRWDKYEMDVLEFMHEHRSLRYELFIQAFPSLAQYEHLVDSGYLHYNAQPGIWRYSMTERGDQLFAHWLSLSEGK